MHLFSYLTLYVILVWGFNLLKIILLILRPRFRLELSISNDIISTKIYNKRDDFDFEIVDFSVIDGDVPCATSYAV